MGIYNVQKTLYFKIFVLKYPVFRSQSTFSDALGFSFEILGVSFEILDILKT